jgi:hypothetical protein
MSRSVQRRDLIPSAYVQAKPSTQLQLITLLPVSASSSQLLATHKYQLLMQLKGTKTTC